MSGFDEIFDTIMDKVKVAADVTGKKTSELMEIGKLKYKAKQITWEIESAYSKLGAIVYESKKTSGDYNNVITSLIEEIDELNKRLDATTKLINDHESMRTSAKAKSSEEKVVVDFDEIFPKDEPTEEPAHYNSTENNQENSDSPNE